MAKISRLFSWIRKLLFGIEKEEAVNNDANNTYDVQSDRLTINEPEDKAGYIGGTDSISASDKKGEILSETNDGEEATTNIEEFDTTDDTDINQIEATQFHVEKQADQFEASLFNYCSDENNEQNGSDQEARIIDDATIDDSDDLEITDDQAEIEQLRLSARSNNALRRAGINTIKELKEIYDKGELRDIKYLGSRGYAEIEANLNNYLLFGKRIEDEKIIVAEELTNIPTEKLRISTRLINSLLRGGFSTVSKVLMMTENDIASLERIGAKSAEELRSVIAEIQEVGIDYFCEERFRHEPIDEQHRRTIDVDTANRLKDNYGLKATWISEWYGITRSRVQQILNQKKNDGNWLNRTLTEDDQKLLSEIIEQKNESLTDDRGVKGYFLNNKKNDCAIVFVSNDEIKCFFMDMLPVEIQNTIREERLDCLSFEEVEMKTSGKTISILKTNCFCPNDLQKFRQNSAARGMSVEDYCLFLTGMKYVTNQNTIDDNKIEEFLRSHATNGLLRIPSNNSTQWFRAFISRNGYTIDEIADLYGYSSANQSKDLKAQDRIEEDMQKYEVNTDDWIDKIFAENPLIGNAILSEKTKEKLYTITKGYIEKKLEEPKITLPLKVKKQIALAVINYAKEWDTSDELGFWKYITSQFGYRDETNRLREILCDCVLQAIERSNRWFISSEKGYQYKSTITVHALTTKKSWMLLYDFLFDFYKTNMDWQYIEDDPIVETMVISLRSKLSAGDEIDDATLEISTKVYSFQEGIRKLIIYRTGYATELIHHMFRRIDDTINQTETPASEYVDVLCDQWMGERLKNARESKYKNAKRESKRIVVIDYSRIRPNYLLKDEINIIVAFPDIRLKQTEFGQIELKVYVGEVIVQEKTLSYYGNELGKTLSGFDVDIDSCMIRGDGSVRVRIELYCDDEKIYDSKETLYRELLCFSGEREHNARDCESGAYSFFVPRNDTLEFVGAEVSEIDAGAAWCAYFARLQNGFLVKHNNEILSFDRVGADTDAGGLRFIYPSTVKGVTYAKNNQKYSVITKESEVLLITHDQNVIRKYAVRMNSERLELSLASTEEEQNSLIYKIPLQFVSNDLICEFEIIDLERNRILSRNFLKKMPGFSYHFNRNFYFTDNDFKDAAVHINYLEGVKEYPIRRVDEFFSVQIDEGVLDIDIPRISIRDNNYEAWCISYTAWIKNIQQEDKIYLCLPDECSAIMTVGDTDIVEESKGCFGFGNAVFAYSGKTDSEWIYIRLRLSLGKTSQEYIIGRISLIERFNSAVQFDYHDGMLHWNRGLGFIGSENAKLQLRIAVSGETVTCPLDLHEEIVPIAIDLPLGKYIYQIEKPSENIFMNEGLVLEKGTLYLGDKNELRFLKNWIVITNITYEEGDSLRSIEINNTYIDQIKFDGIRFVSSENRKCPVYNGVMFYMGQSRRHHEFSFTDTVSEKGVQLYKINPVKIVYINEHTISITNEDGDGIYYYRYYDKNALENRYLLTDREPTAHNQKTYYLADLYIYRTERAI